MCELYYLSFEQHYQHDRNARHQRTRCIVISVKKVDRHQIGIWVALILCKGISEVVNVVVDVVVE